MARAAEEMEKIKEATGHSAAAKRIKDLEEQLHLLSEQARHDQLAAAEPLRDAAAKDQEFTECLSRIRFLDSGQFWFRGSSTGNQGLEEAPLRLCSKEKGM